MLAWYVIHCMYSILYGNKDLHPCKLIYLMSKVKINPSNIVIVILFWLSPFNPSRNLDDIFTYKHIWLKCPFKATLMLRHPWF